MSNHINVYTVDLQVVPADEAACFEALSADERARADRFVRAEDRRRFAVAHAALRWVLAQHSGLSETSIKLLATAAGKPYLDGLSLQFNLSHSYEQALIAVSSHSEVGVDIEYVRPEVDILGISARFFSDREHQQLLALPKSQQLNAFYRCWTLKEAAIKAVGGKLAEAVSTFIVDFCEKTDRKLINQPDWLLDLLPVSTGYVAAIASPLHSEWSIIPFSQAKSL